MIAQPTAALDVRARFEEQRRGYLAESYPSAATRIARLNALERAIRRRRGEIASALGADFRKAPEEVEISEIRPTLDELGFARKRLVRWMRPRRVPTPPILFGAASEVRYEPKGVVLILAPWNYPFYLVMAPLIAAIAAGDRAIVRPSEKVPHVREVMAAIVAEAFAPAEVALVGGEVDTAEALLALPFDHFFFTGSARVGKHVMHAAAEHLASVTLELGGKSPAIVEADADLTLAARRIAWGKFLNDGQTCVAPDYVLVHQRVARPFIERMGASVAGMFGPTEDARAASSDLTRLVDVAAFDRLAEVLAQTTSSGARLELGGRLERTTRYIAPTVLSDVAYDAPIMREEIFGPILPVLPYDSLDAALAFVRSRPKPLALYAFSRSHRSAERILAATSAGGSAVNDVVMHLANPYLPFGGVGASGMGSYHGEYGFRTFSHERAVLRQTPFSLAPLLYPPYTRRTRRMLAVIDRFL